MNAATLQLLEARGYHRLPDGSMARADSHASRGTIVSHGTKPGKRQRGVRSQESGVSKKLPSPLALKFEALWKLLGGPELTPEYRFTKERRWRFDYVNLASMTAIELEGGIFQGGRHTRAKGFQADCEKYNFATSMGWSVTRLATGMLTTDRVQAIIDLIRSRQ